MPYCPNCGKEVQGAPPFCPNCGKSLQTTSASGQQLAYCPHCGAQVDPQAEICPKCGVRIKQPPAPSEKKSPGIAAVLSFIFTGLGQIYNGQIGKGIVFVIVGIVLAATIIVVIGFVLYPVFWIYNIYDAYRTAKRINEGAVKPE